LDKTMKIYSAFQIVFKKMSLLLREIILQIKYSLASRTTMEQRHLIYITSYDRPAQQVQNQFLIRLDQKKIFYRGYQR